MDTINRFKQNNLIAQITIFLVLLTSSSYALAQEQSAGKILAATGEIQVLYADGSLKRKIRRGSEVFSGDIINTKGESKAQMRFKDGTLISLNQNTRFQIDEYKRDQKTEALISSFFSLIQGKFRSITKHVTERDKRAYRVRTSVATMGVRGTDYEASICTKDCEGGAEGQLQLKVHEGAIVIGNEAGEFIMEHGEAGFVNNITEPLQLLPTLIPVVQGRDREIPVAAMRDAIDGGSTSTDNTGDTSTANTTTSDTTADTNVASSDTTGSNTDGVADATDQALLTDAVILPEENIQPATFVTGDVLRCVSY